DHGALRFDAREVPAVSVARPGSVGKPRPSYQGETMKFLGTALGLLVASACGGDPAETQDDGTDVGSMATTSSFQAFHVDREPPFSGGRAVRHAIGAAAARIAALQADTIGDNAHNGLVDSDPDDSGWDFIISPSATQHSPAKSPTNLFGAIGLA